MSFQAIFSDLKAKKYAPIYFLMGEEDYFIDQISDYIENNVLEEAEKGFNQTILYGKDTTCVDIVSAAKRYPMMSEHQVIIIKEAQDLKDFENLEAYVENPLKSTVLVFCHKHKKLDKRKGIAKKLSKNAVLYTSDPLRDYQIADYIQQIGKQEGFSISIKMANLLAENLGLSLSKIANEIIKLKLVIPKGTEITEQIVQDHIGISKDYNVFELQKAVGQRDILKATKIVNYFGKNPKSAHIIPVITNLFNFYSKLMKFHFLKDKSPGNVAKELKVNPYFVKEYQASAKIFNPKIIARNITLLREYDLKSKGVNNSGVESEELMRELIYRLLH